MMLALRRHRSMRTRGQAMVEVALVLPLLLLLLVFTIDLGRVFFGWVGLQNAARIGANYAASHPDAWSAPNTPLKALQRQEFIDQVERDAQAINCALQTIPTPVFSAVGSAAAGDMGSHASVTLDCDFDLITGAFLGGIVASPLHIDAQAIFPVRSGAVAGLPAPIPPPPGACQAPLADFTGNPTSGKKPLTVAFTDASTPQGCPLTSWSWDFGDGSPASTAQSPNHTYAAKGKYTVTLTVTSTAGSDAETKNNYIDVKN